MNFLAECLTFLFLFITGMTQHQQIDLLELFRTGGHKLIVATSVAQEGLDIQACNVVVRYNYISSVVAHVQARGMLMKNNIQMLSNHPFKNFLSDLHKQNVVSSSKTGQRW